jgi:multidrug efflux system membrane fusion protein
VAPADGRVGLRQVDQGNYVTPGDTNGIVVLTQIKPISVIFTLPEDDLVPILDRVNAGAELLVTAYDRSATTELATGTLSTLDNQIDTTTGTVKLRAQFANDKLNLYPNQFVNIRLLVNTLHDATIVPSSAIQRGSPGTFVYLINADNTVSVRVVELGPLDGERQSIKSGLMPGDKVVIDGADKLRDGARVVVRDELGNALAPPAGGGGQRGSGGPGGGQGGGGRRQGGQQGQQPGAPAGGQQPGAPTGSPNAR